MKGIATGTLTNFNLLTYIFLLPFAIFFNPGDAMQKQFTATMLISFSLLSPLSHANTANPALIVVGGDNGTILTSVDGTHWSLHKSNVQDSITALVHKDEQPDSYTAFAYNNQTESLASADAVNWTVKNAGSSWSPDYGLMWDKDKKQFLALNTSWGKIFTSLDGWNWTPQYGSYPEQLDSIAMSQAPAVKMYVAVGGMISSNACPGVVVTSTDGLKWTRLHQAFPCFSNIIWGNNQFIATGQKGGYDQAYEAGFLTSSNGETWVWHSLPNGKNKSVSYVAWGNHLYVAIGTDDKAHGYAGLSYSSTDGVNWTEHPNSGLPSNYVVAMAFVNNVFIAVGEKGLIVTSTDGAHWIKQNSGTSAWLRSIVKNS